MIWRGKVRECRIRRVRLGCGGMWDLILTVQLGERVVIFVISALWTTIPGVVVVRDLRYSSHADQHTLAEQHMRAVRTCIVDAGQVALVCRMSRGRAILEVHC